MNTTRPLDDDEFDELESLLAGLPDSHSLEELDGLFCALITGPEIIPPSEWLPVVYGDAAPAWDSEREGERCASLLMRHWDTVASGFREDWSGVSASEGADAMYFPCLDDPAVSGHPQAEGWARGFRAGFGVLSEAHWDALETDEECVSLLSLIAAFDSGEKSPGIKLTASERDELISVAAAGLQYLYTFWRRWLRVVNAPRKPHIADAQPGRNDECPCGSGKKFKKCCGAPQAPGRVLN